MSSNQPAISIGLDSDQEVSFHSCSKDDEGSDDRGSDSDADCFSTISLKDPDDACEVSGPTGFKDVEGMKLGCGGSPEGLELGRVGQFAEGTQDDECFDVDAVDPADHPKPLKGRSIAHNILTDGSAVLLSLDIEIGGEYAGIVQLSAEIVRMKLVAGRGVAQDQVEDVVRVATFDWYVKP